MQRIKHGFQSLFGLSLPLIKNIIPKKTRVVCVFGEPIDIKMNTTPTESEIDETLEKYTQSVRKLYEKYGPLYNIPSNKPALKII